VIDYSYCSRTFSDAPAGLASFFARTMAAVAGELGGNLSNSSFTAADVSTASRGYVATSLNVVAENEAVRAKAYQFEAARLSQKLGADNPRTVSVKTQADAGVPVTRLVTRSAQAATIQVPVATETTSTISGQLLNSKGQAQAGYVVELVDANGTRVETVGRTDASGYYSATFDERKTAELAQQKLYVRIADPAGKEAFRASEATTVKAGANVRIPTTIPVRVVPRSVVRTATEIFTRPRTETKEPEIDVEPDVVVGGTATGGIRPVTPTDVSGEKPPTGGKTPADDTSPTRDTTPTGDKAPTGDKTPVDDKTPTRGGTKRSAARKTAKAESAGGDTPEAPKPTARRRTKKEK
jgi:hypothetical protein